MPASGIPDVISQFTLPSMLPECLLGNPQSNVLGGNTFWISLS